MARPARTPGVQPVRRDGPLGVRPGLDKITRLCLRRRLDEPRRQVRHRRRPTPARGLSSPERLASNPPRPGVQPVVDRVQPRSASPVTVPRPRRRQNRQASLGGLWCPTLDLRRCEVSHLNAGGVQGLDGQVQPRRRDDLHRGQCPIGGRDLSFTGVSVASGTVHTPCRSQPPRPRHTIAASAGRYRSTFGSPPAPRPAGPGPTGARGRGADPPWWPG